MIERKAMRKPEPWDTKGTLDPLVMTRTLCGSTPVPSSTRAGSWECMCMFGNTLIDAGEVVEG